MNRELTIVADEADAIKRITGFATNPLTGQSLVVRHGHFME